jgi:hypothetical protein
MEELSRTESRLTIKCVLLFDLTCNFGINVLVSEARNLAFLRDKRKEGVGMNRMNYLELPLPFLLVFCSDSSVFGWMLEAYGGTTPIASTQYCWKDDEDPFWAEETARYTCWLACLSWQCCCILFFVRVIYSIG